MQERIFEWPLIAEFRAGLENIRLLCSAWRCRQSTFSNRSMVTNEWDHPAGYTFWVGIRFRNSTSRDFQNGTTCGGADAAGAAYSGSRFPWSLNARDRGHPATCGGADAAGAAYSGSRLPWSPKVRDQGHPSSLGPWFPAHAPEKGARTGHGAVSVGLGLGGLGFVLSHLSRKSRGEGGAPRMVGFPGGWGTRFAARWLAHWDQAGGGGLFRRGVGEVDGSGRWPEVEAGAHGVQPHQQVLLVECQGEFP